MAISKIISVDELMEMVSVGGMLRTGIDLFNKNNVLLLSGDHVVNNVNTLLHLKTMGLTEIPINVENQGGIWDQNGNERSIEHESEGNHVPASELKKPADSRSTDIKKKIIEIHEVKREAKQKYKKAKKNIIKVIEDIKSTGGEFDYGLVENTVMDIFNFITRKENAFSYLTKELFSYDDYLYNHSLNVCIIGTAVIRRFNEHFSSEINKYLSNRYYENTHEHEKSSSVSFLYYLPEELYDISIGFFLHDIGKVMIPEGTLNKEGALSKEEFKLVKNHSLEYGIRLLNKNKVKSPFINNIIKYHHGILFKGEKNCYPTDRYYLENPAYVKICKLADIYDAMTSKRCYKEAFNPVVVVTDLFHEYAHKDPMLQFILHSFVNTVGIYPPGSLVFLRDGRMAYIVESQGPLVIPFTDTHGTTLSRQQDPIALDELGEDEEDFKIDRRKPVLSQAEVYSLLPSFLKESM